MPKSVQPKAKAHLKDIWMAETKAAADTAFDYFVEAYGVKYGRAVKCLIKDRGDLFARLTTSPPSTGNTSGHRTRSKAPLPRSGTEPPKPRDATADRQRGP